MNNWRSTQHPEHKFELRIASISTASYGPIAFATTKSLERCRGRGEFRWEFKTDRYRSHNVYRYEHAQLPFNQIEAIEQQFLPAITEGQFSFLSSNGDRKLEDLDCLKISSGRGSWETYGVTLPFAYANHDFMGAAIQTFREFSQAMEIPAQHLYLQPTREEVWTTTTHGKVIYDAAAVAAYEQGVQFAGIGHPSGGRGYKETWRKKK